MQGFDLSRYVRENPGLTMLNCSARPIDIEDMRILSAYLNNNTSLVELNLIDCELYDLSVFELSDAITRSTSLKSLDISLNNKVTTEGFANIANALQYNSSIVDLNVSLCAMNSESLYHFSEMLKVNNSLTSLNLNGNAIDDMTSLSDALKINTSLRLLDVSSNIWACSQQDAFFEMMLQNSSLLQLKLKNINWDNYLIIEQQVKLNCSLEQRCMLPLIDFAKTEEVFDNVVWMIASVKKVVNQDFGINDVLDKIQWFYLGNLNYHLSELLEQSVEEDEVSEDYSIEGVEMYDIEQALHLDNNVEKVIPAPNYINR